MQGSLSGLGWPVKLGRNSFSAASGGTAGVVERSALAFLTTGSAFGLAWNQADQIIVGGGGGLSRIMADGTLDATKVTLAEYLQVSFLACISGDGVDVEQKMMYGGNLYTLHACATQINPNQPVTSIKREV